MCVFCLHSLVTIGLFFYADLLLVCKEVMPSVIPLEHIRSVLLCQMWHYLKSVFVLDLRVEAILFRAIFLKLLEEKILQKLVVQSV